MDKPSALHFIKNAIPFICSKDSVELTDEFESIAIKYFRMGVVKAAQYLLALPENERAYILGYVDGLDDSIENVD